MRTILFDLDGTLLPMDQKGFERAYFKSLCSALPEVEPKLLIQAIWSGTHAMAANSGKQTNREVFAEQFTKDGPLDFYQNEDRFASYYQTTFQACASACRISAVSREIFETLQRKNYRIVIATNPIFPEIATYSRLHWLGIDPQQAALITTYENSHFAKPNPSYFQEILEQINEQAENCRMFGNDAEEDGAAAKVGIPVTLVTDCLINTKNLSTENFTLMTLSEVLTWAKDLPSYQE